MLQIQWQKALRGSVGFPAAKPPLYHNKKAGLIAVNPQEGVDGKGGSVFG